ncbi:Hypothetical predicted protein [Mytilus galloprovincialis]|uniref:Uncharacterized protein n=1 Tax=Mytilus galloprovincialis TaxID=29158 RepID=A0A8B6GJQ9_MYTGA|nr:Hypothetical predicted protein [Mytilus galloprovincialis]
MSSENTIARDRATHIYDDMHVPVPRAETDGEQIYSQANFNEKTEETCSKRISHQYEKLIGLAKKQKNRMCVFGIISLLVAIFSLTGAIIFSILYAKPTYCDKLLKESWLMVCKPFGKQGGTSIICPESTTVVITQVNITWYIYEGQTNMPNCDVSPSCINHRDNLTDSMRKYCAGKPSCVIDSKFFNKHSDSCQDQENREIYFLMSSGITESRDRTTHIYDDIHVPVPHAETDEEQNDCRPTYNKKSKKTFPNRISHQYEKLIGLAKRKRNRMCIFGIVSALVAIFSLTGAIIFSIFYAKPTFCDKLLKENWLLVCKPSGSQGGTSIICPESKSVAITKVNVIRYRNMFLNQKKMPNCEVSTSCIKTSDNITESMQNYCGGKNSCEIGSIYFDKHSESCQEQGYDLLKVTFLCS